MTLKEMLDRVEAVIDIEVNQIEESLSTDEEEEIVEGVWMSVEEQGFLTVNSNV